jgi:hypothetical protein
MSGREAGGWAAAAWRCGRMASRVVARRLAHAECIGSRGTIRPLASRAPGGGGCALLAEAAFARAESSCVGCASFLPPSSTDLYTQQARRNSPRPAAPRPSAAGSAANAAAACATRQDAIRAAPREHALLSLLALCSPGPRATACLGLGGRDGCECQCCEATASGRAGPGPGQLARRLWLGVPAGRQGGGRAHPSAVTAPTGPRAVTETPRESQGQSGPGWPGLSGGHRHQY